MPEEEKNADKYLDVSLLPFQRAQIEISFKYNFL